MAEWIDDVIFDVDKIRNIVFRGPSGKECHINPLDFLYAIKYAVKKSGGMVVEEEAAEIINDGTYSAGNLYECDPEKNTECNKRGCFINGGECRHTTHAKYAKED